VSVPQWYEYDNANARVPANAASSVNRVAIGTFNGAMWAKDVDGASTYLYWTTNGRTFTKGAKLPDDSDRQNIWITDVGFFSLECPDTANDTSDGEIWKSATGLADDPFAKVLDGGVAVGAGAAFVPYGVPRSLCYVGETAGNAGGVVLFFEYTTDALDPLIWYSVDDGATWAVLGGTPGTDSPSADLINHFHGAVWCANQKVLLVMTGDNVFRDSILWCDDVDDLIANPATWMARWGLLGVARTADSDYVINTDLVASGAPAGQNFRAVDLVVDGDYVYYIEDDPDDARGTQAIKFHVTTRAVTPISTMTATVTQGANWANLVAGIRVQADWGSSYWNGDVVGKTDTTVTLGVIDDPSDITDAGCCRRIKLFPDSSVTMATLTQFGDDATWTNWCIGSGWRGLLYDDTVLIATASEYEAGAYKDGQDEYLRVYAIINDVPVELIKILRADHAAPAGTLFPRYMFAHGSALWLAYSAPVLNRLQVATRTIAARLGAPLRLRGRRTSRHPSIVTGPR